MDSSLNSGNIRFLVLAFIFSTLSIFFAHWIYPSAASLLSISFLVIALTPSFYRLIEREELIVAHGAHKPPFLKRYEPVITAYVCIALGVFLSLSLWFTALPSDPTYTTNGYCSTTLPCKEEVFSLQLEASVAGVDPARSLVIMGLAFSLALFFGTGALLILLWDISVIVVLLSLEPVQFVMRLPHEIAYFLAGLSGALLSVAVIRHEWRSHSFFAVLKDSLVLMGLATLIVLFLFVIT